MGIIRMIRWLFLVVMVLAAFPVHAQDDPGEDVPDFQVATDRSIGIAMSETNCNVTMMPADEAEGWVMSRVVGDHVGEVCITVSEAIRWRHHNVWDYGKTLTLIVEGRHASGARQKVPVFLTMENEPEQ